MNNYIPNNYNFNFQNESNNVPSLVKVIKEGVELLGKNVNNQLFDAYQNYVLATLKIISVNTGRDYLTQYMDIFCSPFNYINGQNNMFYPSSSYMNEQNNNEKVKRIAIYLLDIIQFL